ncbi:MAG: CoA protein activase [Firmicutes bacterium]|nr:CoA protein activase [Bacillota bacterium]
MKVTFPHMGNMWIPVKTMLEYVGLEVIVPPVPSKKTLSLGTKYSPATACLPLKINIGNFIEAFELGADTIVMGGGWGPCRFGYYAEVEREILTDLGYKFNMIVLEAPDNKLSEFLKQVRVLAGDHSWFEVVRAIRLAWFKARAVDIVEEEAERWRSRERVYGGVDRTFTEALAKIDAAKTRLEIDGAVRWAQNAYRQLDLDYYKSVLRIGLVGEIYTVLEPFVNLEIERRLGRLGVEVSRSIYLSEWINDHLFGGFLRLPGAREARRLSSPYLNYFVGGHGRETVGSTVKFAQENFDGVIQIGPLTCMPEIVAQSVLSKVSQDLGIPTMTLYFDEHSGEAGLVTRLEAFVDLLSRRRARRKMSEVQMQ